MCALLRPFTGYIPTAEFANRVVGPPSLTLSADQREQARTDPLSFRFAAGRAAGRSHDDAVAWIAERRADGALRSVEQAVLGYRQTQDDLVATGIIADASISAYELARVKRHERTIAKTLDKMAGYMRSTRVYGNPISLTHRPEPRVSTTTSAFTAQPADVSFRTVDDVAHELWLLEGSEAEYLCELFTTDLYITDGHHRLAAAAAVAAEESRTDAYLPAGVFSSEQLRLRSFARCIVDPQLDIAAAIDRISSRHQLYELGADQARPLAAGQFGVKLGNRYFRMQLDVRQAEMRPPDSLDVKMLQDQVLGPVFGITKPRKDKRLRFVADLTSQSHAAIEADAWFLPFPVQVTDVMAVADSGKVMPAKSTWFAPKVPSGLAIRTVD